MLRTGRWLIILTFALGLCACSAGAAGTTVTEKNAGETVTLTVGDVLIVKLEGNPSTGYNWEPENKELTTLEMDGLPDFDPDKNMPGSPGMVTLRFNAVAAGQETLKLVYHRSWEADEEPLDTFTILVEIQ